MPQSPGARWRLAEPVLGLLLLGAVWAAYGPALTGGLLWDDDAHVTRGALQGWDGLRRIWCELGATQQYYPVLHSAFWLEHRLWADALLGYHLATVTLHAIGALLVVLVGQRLGIRGAWIAGFLFALHPVQVESVAWISEQKNTLSLVFALCATLAWLRFDERRSLGAWLTAFALFALALGTKTVTATLPCVLLVVAWWRRGTLDWRRDAAPLAPWLVVGIAAGLGTAWVERHLIGASGDEFTHSAVQRMLLAGRALAHYLTTFLWPARLVFTYPRWSIEPRAVLAWLWPLAMVGLTVALWRVRHRSRAPLAAWLIFAGALFPVLGFVDVYPFRYSFVADHFQYHAGVALCLLAGGGAGWLYRRADALGGARVLALSPAVVLLLLGVLTWRQAHSYRDAETLYRATLAGNPASWMAHHNLGRLVSRKPGGLTEAVTHFEATIRLKPDHARAHYSLAVALQRLARGVEAIPHLEAAIRLEPANRMLVGNAHYILGDILRSDTTRLDEAVAHLQAAVRLKPMVAEAHALLGAALLAAGRHQEAQHALAEALRLQTRGAAPRAHRGGKSEGPAPP